MKAVESQTVLITGATDGLGKRVALDLAARGATVLVHGRNREKGEEVLAELRKRAGGGRCRYYQADFASLDEVRSLADRVAVDYDRLDVLVNNAGMGAGVRASSRELSADGRELRFAVNYLAPFLLTHRLLPLLRGAAPARVVNVSSVGQQPIDFDDVMLESGYDGLRAYRQSKLAQVMFGFDLAERLAGSGVAVTSLHPATLMPTNMVLETDYFGGPVATLDEGARAVEHLAVGEDTADVTGAYFDGMREGRADPQAYDAEARARLWALSVRLTGVGELG
jgi:NAD(P)-dependent dehydrogenase (short-subunit alcohol dehydrogenase family)